MPGQASTIQHSIAQQRTEFVQKVSAEARSQTLLTLLQVKEEFLEQVWSALMDDPFDVEMNGAQEAEAEEIGEDWGEDGGEMGEEENWEDDPLVEESGC